MKNSEIKPGKEFDNACGKYNLFILFPLLIICGILFTFLTSEQRKGPALVVHRNGKKTILMKDTSIRIIPISAALYQGNLYIKWNCNTQTKGYYLIERFVSLSDIHYVGILRVNDEKNSFRSFVYKNVPKDIFSYRIKYIMDNNIYSESNIIVPENVKEFPPFPFQLRKIN